LTFQEIGRQLGTSPKAVADMLRRMTPPQRPGILCRACGAAIGSTGVRHRDAGTTLCPICVTQDPRATFGQRLKAFRLAADLTRKQLSQLSRVDPEKIRAYEMGLLVPEDRAREKLARALGLTVKQLTSGEQLNGHTGPAQAAAAVNPRRWSAAYTGFHRATS
jgi:hypothetical protein